MGHICAYVGMYVCVYRYMYVHTYIHLHLACRVTMKNDSPQKSKEYLNHPIWWSENCSSEELVHARRCNRRLETSASTQIILRRLGAGKASRLAPTEKACCSH